MKRSKFLNKLNDKLNIAWGYDNDLSIDRLDFILELVEVLGMSPPRNKQAEKYSAKFGQYPDEYTIPVNTWEPEEREGT